MGWVRAVAVVAVVLGCGAAKDDRYSPPDKSVPQVELVFGRGYSSGLGLSPQVRYEIASAGECVQRQIAAYRLDQKKQIKAKVQAERPILLRAITTYTWQEPTGYQTYTVYAAHCEARAIFTPRLGSNYEVISVAPWRDQNCRLNVNSARDGSTPVDLVQDVHALCPMEWRPIGRRAEAPASAIAAG